MIVNEEQQVIFFKQKKISDRSYYACVIKPIKPLKSKSWIWPQKSNKKLNGMLLFSKQLKLWPFTTHMFFSLVKNEKKELF